MSELDLNLLDEDDDLDLDDLSLFKSNTTNFPDHHKEKLIKVEPDDPTRCQTNTRTGQCEFKSVEGINKCIIHGRTEASNLRKEQKRIYTLTQLGLDDALYANLTNKNILNLRQEIALLRVTLQERLSVCKTNNDLAIASGTISQLVAQVTQTVTLAHKLEESLGKYLDKAELNEFLVTLEEAINKIVPDDEIKYQLGQEILRIAKTKLDKAM